MIGLYSYCPYPCPCPHRNQAQREDDVQQQVAYDRHARVPSFRPRNATFSQKMHASFKLTFTFFEYPRFVSTHPCEDHSNDVVPVPSYVPQTRDEVEMTLLLLVSTWFSSLYCRFLLLLLKTKEVWVQMSCLESNFETFQLIFETTRCSSSSRIILCLESFRRFPHVDLADFPNPIDHDFIVATVFCTRTSISEGSSSTTAPVWHHLAFASWLVQLQHS